MTNAPIIGIAGWKNSGKTTLAVRLVEELTGRGFRVATIKHAHHALRLDEEGTDSARHRADREMDDRDQHEEVEIVRCQRLLTEKDRPVDAKDAIGILVDDE